MIVDYHLHLRPDGSELDEHAYAPEHLQQYVAAARGRGIGEIAITEHVYRFRQAAGLSDHIYWREHTVSDLTLYHDRLATARDSGLPILVGLELDWLGADRAGAVKEIATGYAVGRGARLGALVGAAGLRPSGLLDLGRPPGGRGVAAVRRRRLPARPPRPASTT